jgi:hypothetical protein
MSRPITIRASGVSLAVAADFSEKYDHRYDIELEDILNLTFRAVGPLRSGGQRRDSAGGGSGGIGPISRMLVRYRKQSDAMVEEAIELDLLAAFGESHGWSEDEALVRLEAEAEQWVWEQVVRRLDELANEADGVEPELRLPWWAVETKVEPFTLQGDLLVFTGAA